MVILGPTSSGKSDLAVDMAKEENGEIISADSRQIYKDMDLGTGKVEGKWKNQPQITNYKFQTNSKCEMTNLKHKNPARNASHIEAGGSLSPPFKKGEDNKKIFVYKSVPHYLIDFVSPKKEYNISHFKRDCEKLIKDINKCGKMPIICGGTGFWVSSVVLDEKFPQVKPNSLLRSMLRNKTAKELFEELKKLDPQRAKGIDHQNRQRLIRAIEIATELGEVPEIKKGNYEIADSYGGLISVWRSNLRPQIVKLKKENEIWNFHQLALDVKMEKLEKRIKKRLKQRFEAGMIEEVKKLKEKYNLSWEKIQSFGLAYFWIPLYLQKKISKNELEERVYLAERQYAKRQLTWLKKQEGVNWI